MSSLFAQARTWALLGAASLTIMSNATIAPALPGLEAHFADTHNSAMLARLLVTAPSLVVVLTATVFGSLIDRCGRKRPLLIGVALYALFGTAGLYLPDLYSILASRLALGLAVAIIMTAQSALVGDYFSGSVRAGFLGYQTAASHFGGLVFVTMAGVLAKLDPRAPFAIYGLSAVLFPLLWTKLNETHRLTSSSDATVSNASHRGWISKVLAMSIGVFATMAFYYVIPTQIPFFLIDRGYLDPQLAGWALGALMITGGISGLLYGRIRGYLGANITPLAGFLLFSAGFIGLVWAGSPVTHCIATGVIGCGIGLVMPTFMAAGLQAAPTHRRGIAAGAITSSLFAGQFISPLVSQPLATHFGYDGMFFIIAGAFVIIGIVISVSASSTYTHPQ